MSTGTVISPQLEHSVNRHASFRNLCIVLSNLTGIFTTVAILMAVMSLVCSFWIGEPENSYAFTVGFGVSAAIALLLKFTVPDKGELELRHAMLVAAIAYLVVPALSVVPFIMIQQMSPVDAYFEAISGWTGSGFSLILYPENSSHAIQLWRSVTQWIGGIGVIVLMVSILIRPGTSTYIMYQSEARKDRIKPSMRSTINTIWFLYLLLTIIGILALAVVGMPWWDSVNHSMTAIGTGGFSIYSDSIGHYDSIPIEIVIIGIMFLGALPFAFIYKVVKNPGKLLPLDIQVRAFIGFIVAGTVCLVVENYFVSGNLLPTIRYSVFQLVSAISCTGFQSTAISDWSPTALLILSIVMIIGGCAGSTAGGIKVARAIFLSDEVRLWLRRTVLPRRAIVMVNVGNRRISEDMLNKELAEATLISFLWVVTILVSVIVLLHVAGPGYDLSDVVFTVCSAQGNVGISVGIIEPGMNLFGEIMLIINMWIGRLEIIPVTLLIRYLLKGFGI